MTSPTPTPAFVTTESAIGPNQVTGIVPLDSYLVRYKDQEGHDQTRVCMHVPETDTVYVVQHRITGQPVVTNATGWFKKGFTERLTRLQQGEEEVQSV